MKKVFKRNKIKVVLLLTIMLFGITACEEGELTDINTNPFAATNIDPSLLFPQIVVGISQQRTIELNSINIQAQHWTSGGSAGVFRNPETYIISANTTNNAWSGWFLTSLRNLLQVRVLTETNNPGNTHVIAQAKVLEAFTFYNATLVFGSIPFSEATNVAEFPNPSFDSQEEVLLGIVERCNEAIAIFNQPSEGIISDADLLFKGDVNSWVRFANTLKLKTLMLIANVNPSSVQSEIQSLLNEPLILDNSQEASLNYTEEIGNQNPIWRTLDLFSGGTNIFWYSGSTLVDLMNNLNDPRRATYFDLNADGQYVGQDQGVFTPTGISRVSLNIIRPDAPDIYASASETNFLLADAAANGIIPGGLAQANTYFQTAVQASLDSYDGVPGAIADADKTTYLGSLPNLGTLSQADALRVIHEQHYISLFSRGIEAWTLWRRTKTPDFQLPTDAALNTIIRRYQYPASEVSSNPNAPSEVPLEVPMWFENE